MYAAASTRCAGSHLFQKEENYLKSKFFDRPVASLQIAPLATIGFIVGILLVVIGGLRGPSTDMLWFGVGICMFGGFFLYYNEPEIEQRLAVIKSARLCE